MISDYSAACGLLGGLRRNSFKDEEIKGLEDKDYSSLKEVLRKYLGTDYPVREGLEALEHALYVSHIKRVCRLLKFLGSSVSEPIKVLLFEFDVLNLKLIARRIHFNTDAGKDLFYYGFPYLSFKDKNPAEFKHFEEVAAYLERKPAIKKFFERALQDLKFHKDIFYFDVRLDAEYLGLLRETSRGLDRYSETLIKYFIMLTRTTYVLRLKFFQNRTKEDIMSLIGYTDFFERNMFSELLDCSSLKEAVSYMEKTSPFAKFHLPISDDFEENLRNMFYEHFLRRRGVDFFSMHPYLIFYLGQRYLIEKMIFILNEKSG